MNNTIDYISLKNGDNYIIIDEILINNTKYAYLAKASNAKDFMIKKVLVKNNQEYLCPIENEEEFKRILNLFEEKNINDL